ncbi:MAG: RluA family pseudouridine synthase [bacterium]|nr:RluA family pseudouridine synthase [bacterium]
MITIKEAEAEIRLDQFLVKKKPKFSRSYWQKEIKAGRILVNDKIVSAHQKLVIGDKIKIVAAPAAPPPLPAPPLKVIAETNDFIIIEKPTGLLVHPTDTGRESTLIDSLIAYEPKIKKVGEDPKRPGIVHRLDREVSGVMVIAKTQKMFNHLKEQFAERKMKKEYTALVKGKLIKDTDEINFTIGHKEGSGRMAARPALGDDREAVTKYEVLKRFANSTLVLVKPETGRTHQIRAHFHALGHPIVGDTIYRLKRQSREPEAPRLMLHATKLSFSDLSDTEQTFESPLPKKFAEFIEQLNS